MELMTYTELVRDPRWGKRFYRQEGNKFYFI